MLAVEISIYSQTSIRAPPLGLDSTGCYTQVAVLSRLSQNCHYANNLYWLPFAAILYMYNYSSKWCKYA